MGPSEPACWSDVTSPLFDCSAMCWSALVRDAGSAGDGNPPLMPPTLSSASFNALLRGAAASPPPALLLAPCEVTGAAAEWIGDAYC